jgi:hypothetical protein
VLKFRHDRRDQRCWTEFEDQHEDRKRAAGSQSRRLNVQQPRYQGRDAGRRQSQDRAKNYDPEFRGVGKNIASTISTTTKAMPKAKMAGFAVPQSASFAFASSYGPAEYLIKAALVE